MEPNTKHLMTYINWMSTLVLILLMGASILLDIITGYNPFVVFIGLAFSMLLTVLFKYLSIRVFWDHVRLHF